MFALAGLNLAGRGIRCLDDGDVFVQARIVVNERVALAVKIFNRRLNVTTAGTE